MLTTIWKDFDRYGAPTPGAWKPLLRQIDDMFNELRVPAWPEGAVGFSPVYDVHESEEAYTLSFDVPGVDRDEIAIELLGSRLSISGERKAAGSRQGNGESRYGKFEVVFTLPDGVKADAIEAVHKDGVLTLTVPKPVTAKATRIRINESTEKGGFFKNLIGEKKNAAKEVDVKQEHVAMAN